MYPIFPVLAAGGSADWLVSETLLDGLLHSCEVTGLILIFSLFNVTSRRSSRPCGWSFKTTCSHACDHYLTAIPPHTLQRCEHKVSNGWELGMLQLIRCRALKLEHD